MRSPSGNTTRLMFVRLPSSLPEDVSAFVKIYGPVAWGSGESPIGSGRSTGVGWEVSDARGSAIGRTFTPGRMG